MPACSSSTLTNVLPHMNAMPQTQDMTPHLVTVYRHGADLSQCYPLCGTSRVFTCVTHRLVFLVLFLGVAVLCVCVYMCYSQTCVSCVVPRCSGVMCVCLHVLLTDLCFLCCSSV